MAVTCVGVVKFKIQGSFHFNIGIVTADVNGDAFYCTSADIQLKEQFQIIYALKQSLKEYCYLKRYSFHVLNQRTRNARAVPYCFEPSASSTPLPILLEKSTVALNFVTP